MKKRSLPPIFFPLWLLVALGWPFGTHAQQALVSNLGQTDHATPSIIASTILTNPLDHAQQFTTGSNSAGYRLSSVEIEFNRLDAGIPFSVSIRTNASGSPGTVVGTLANPSYTAFTTDTVLTFSAGGDGIALAANTSYFLVLDVTDDTGSNFAYWRVTTSMSEDSGAASGWSIADHAPFPAKHGRCRVDQQPCPLQPQNSHQRLGRHPPHGHHRPRCHAGHRRRGCPLHRQPHGRDHGGVGGASVGVREQCWRAELRGVNQRGRQISQHSYGFRIGGLFRGDRGRCHRRAGRRGDGDCGERFRLYRRQPVNGGA